WNIRDNWDNRIVTRFSVSQYQFFTWDTWDKFFWLNFFSNNEYHLITIRSQGFKALDTLLNYTQYFSRAVSFYGSTVP
ncbi:TPA: hypothetical protein ACT9MN_002186, partial [Legionella pneumophila]